MTTILYFFWGGFGGEAASTVARVGKRYDMRVNDTARANIAVQASRIDMKTEQPTRADG